MISREAPSSVNIRRQRNIAKLLKYVIQIFQTNFLENFKVTRNNIVYSINRGRIYQAIKLYHSYDNSSITWVAVLKDKYEINITSTFFLQIRNNDVWACHNLKPAGRQDHQHFTTAGWFLYYTGRNRYVPLSGDWFDTRQIWHYEWRESDPLKMLSCRRLVKLSTAKVTRKLSREASQQHCQYINGHVPL